jgi:hypothetical protein
MHFDPIGGTASWVTHAEFAEQLAAMLQRRSIDPKKVFLVLYSCRSGDAFEKDKYGKHVKGSLVITSCPDKDSLGASGKFPGCIIECAKQEAVKSWADFTKCVKECVKKAQEAATDPEEKKQLKEPKVGKPKE